MTTTEARKAVTDRINLMDWDTADLLDIEDLIDKAIRAAEEEMKIGAFGTAINQVRHDCTNCKGKGWEPTSDPQHPYECEYCGRPMAAIRALKGGT